MSSALHSTENSSNRKSSYTVVHLPLLINNLNRHFQINTDFKVKTMFCQKTAKQFAQFVHFQHYFFTFRFFISAFLNRLYDGKIVLYNCITSYTLFACVEVMQHVHPLRKVFCGLSGGETNLTAVLLSCLASLQQRNSSSGSSKSIW